MDLWKESIILPREFPFRMFKTCGSTDAIPILHWHDCLELNFILSGQGLNVIGSTRHEVKPGEVYIINNNEYHYAFSDGSMEMLVIVFDPFLIWPNSIFDYDYLKPFFERKVSFCNRIDAAAPLSHEIGLLMVEIKKEYDEQNVGYQLIIKALLMKILGLLFRHLKLDGQLSGEALDRQQAFERIKCAITYIDANYTEELLLEEMARLSYMNPTYFSAYFRKVMQQSFTDYTINLRINHAARLLKLTSKSITEICNESGFSSLSHFNRSFKKFAGNSPSQYKKANESKEKAKQT